MLRERLRLTEERLNAEHADAVVKERLERSKDIDALRMKVNALKQAFAHRYDGVSGVLGLGFGVLCPANETANNTLFDQTNCRACVCRKLPDT